MNQSRESIHTVVVHCSATKAGVWVDRADIDKMHRARNFPRYSLEDGPHWCGYHLLIHLDGTWRVTRPLTIVGAHVKGANRGSVGICMVGGLDKDGKPADTFSQAQYDALYEILWLFRTPGDELFLPNLKRILGHRDYSPDLNGDGQIDRTEWLKECPCWDVQTWLPSIGMGQYMLPAFVDLGDAG